MKAGYFKDRMTFFGFTVIPVALYSFFYVYSMIIGIRYSFTDWNGMDLNYNYVGFDNYVRLFKNPNFIGSLKTTVLYAIMLVTGVIVLALVLALSLNSLKRIKTLMKSIYFFPAMIGSVTIALIWDQLFLRGIPVIGEALNIPWLYQSPLATKSTALVAVVLVHIWQAVAMPTVIFLAGLQSIPDEMYESAMLDGASPFKRFQYITFPYLLPTVTVNLVLLVKQGFTSFDYPYAMVKGGPARATEVIGITIYQDAFANFRFSVANAEAVILFVIVACISIIQITLTRNKGVNG